MKKINLCFNRKLHLLKMGEKVTESLHLLKSERKKSEESLCNKQKLQNLFTEPLEKAE